MSRLTLFKDKIQFKAVVRLVGTGWKVGSVSSKALTELAGKEVIVSVEAVKK